MADDTLELRATELAVSVLAARVAAAAGRPTLAEGMEAAAYLRIIRGEIRDGLGLPPREQEGQGGGDA